MAARIAAKWNMERQPEKAESTERGADEFTVVALWKRAHDDGTARRPN